MVLLSAVASPSLAHGCLLSRRVQRSRREVAARAQPSLVQVQVPFMPPESFAQLLGALAYLLAVKASHVAPAAVPARSGHGIDDRRLNVVPCRFLQAARRHYGKEQEPHGAQPDVQGAQAQHQEAEAEHLRVAEGGASPPPLRVEVFYTHVRCDSPLVFAACCLLSKAS